MIKRCQHCQTWNHSKRGECPKQAEIDRLRRVLHTISDSRPDAYMDIEKNPELVNWICDTCHKASVGAYPSNETSPFVGATEMKP